MSIQILNAPLSRLSLGHGGPRDLAAVANGLKETSLIAGHITDATNKGVSSLAMPQSLPACLETMLVARAACG